MKILHLSDPHFGYLPPVGSAAQESAHFFVDERGTPQPTVLPSILIKQVDPAPDLVVISGDLGWDGGHDDYLLASSFLESLKREWRRAWFVLAPGNHDVNIEATCASEDRQEEYWAFVKRFYDAEAIDRHPFRAGCAKDQQREMLIGVHYQPAMFFVASINSAASINGVNDPVVVGPEPLRLIGEELEKLAPGGDVIRILVLHHHLLPFVEPPWGNTCDAKKAKEKPDTTLVANSATLQSWLAKHSFDLVLHGHKHRFHGREDVLWQSAKAGERRLLILGAGSCGVSRKGLGRNVFHSLNVIDCSSTQEHVWSARIRVGELAENPAYCRDLTWHQREVECGNRPRTAVCEFHARGPAACHRAIQDRVRGRGEIRNFISVVEQSSDECPASASIGKRACTADEVNRSFLALHPEYDPEDRWDNPEKIDEALSRIPMAYRIQHGPRMFGRVRPLRIPGQPEGELLRPIRGALANVLKHPSRAYLGLYNAECDVGLGFEPMPGLVGIQFVASDRALDIVLTFRNLELSFWWAVNMLEAHRLLEWGCKHVGNEYGPGRVTMFAASAEWRDDPRPMFNSDIDAMRYEEMFYLMVAAATGVRTHVKSLANKLAEKADQTSVLNIDCQGLEHMVALGKGILLERKRDKKDTIDSPIDTCLTESLEDCLDLFRQAVKEQERAPLIVRAQRRLRNVVDQLENWTASASTT